MEENNRKASICSCLQAPGATDDLIMRCSSSELLPNVALKFPSFQLTWRDMPAVDTKLIQNTRIGTMCPGAVDITPVTSSASTISSASVSSADITSATTSTSALSLNKPLVKDEEHGEYAQKVKDLTEEIIKAAELKQANTQKLVDAVNEVKKLEVELDRAGHNLSQIQQKYNDHESAVSELRLRAKNIHEQLVNAREMDRRRNT
ncbi:hypothetical protein OESDEN_06090 [Oesophagostomum dentatum]|uniref:Uncharacterized protein n=1 Tax=Oesophagostomum dentatum TaxID=61180 RepID=A0A0B1T8T2_OESDE|nr:hypothetical protein OESDEN_06090 [Oesophagostomum dentatum]